MLRAFGVVLVNTQLQVLLTLFFFRMNPRIPRQNRSAWQGTFEDNGPLSYLDSSIILTPTTLLKRLATLSEDKGILPCSPYTKCGLYMTGPET